MKMSEWAKREVEIMKGKNPPYEGEFDYVGGCCDSALKAFESLMEDGHSGMSISITKDILMKLIDGVALTPIEDTPDVWGEPDRWGNGKTTYQCKRMSSLFKEVYDDGRVGYTDVRRYYGISIDNPDYTYTGGGLCNILDEMFPITMPYAPKQGKYKFYTDEFLHDEGNGDYDCKGIYHVVTPEGEKVEINEFYYYPKRGVKIKLTKEEYERMKAERVNP